jgi:hypothetical protein
MDTAEHWAMRRRQLEGQQHDLLAALPALGPDEIRWTVRFLADGLTQQRRASLLAGYHEDLSPERARSYLGDLIREVTRLRLLDLEAVRDATPDSLGSLTDTDLQSMSALEKWSLIAQEPGGLNAERLARELARLTLCLTPDLLADPTLPRAAVEFPAYFRVQEALRTLPEADLSRLAALAAGEIAALSRLRTQESATRLRGLSHAIGRAAGLTGPLQEQLGAPMARLPRAFFPPGPEPDDAAGAIDAAVQDLEHRSPTELRQLLRSLADRLSLGELQELLGPARTAYPSLESIPAELLRRLVATVVVRTSGRSPGDVLGRYRAGRLLARPAVSPEVWALLSLEDRARLVHEDTAALDAAQAARHLARYLCSPDYRTLEDGAAQDALTISTPYQESVEALLRLGTPDGAPALPALAQEVSRRALGMEQAPRGAREEALAEIRRLLFESLGHHPRDSQPNECPPA